MLKAAGKVYRVMGPVVEAEEVTFLRMLDMVEVGREHLVGEVVRLKNDKAYLHCWPYGCRQVYIYRSIG